MADLTLDERVVISSNPLLEVLSPVCEALCEAFPDPDEDDGHHERQRPKVFVAMMSKLFSALSATDVPLLLASRIGRESLLSDISLVRSLLQRGGIEVDKFLPLSRLITRRAPDVDIWVAVIALIKSIYHSSPPPSQPLPQDTPVTHSSASQQGSEQTRRMLEPRIFEEIRHCTYRDVEGFHTKFFEAKRWERRARRAWTIFKHSYDETQRRWTNLPKAPTEDECCAWWMGLSNHLSSERLTYFRSNQKNAVGPKDTKRQLDLLVKGRRSVQQDTRHGWADVLVVGELKRSEKTSKALWLQLGSAVRHVFANQPTRRFVHAFSLTGTKLENWVFDRSGTYSGTLFDVNEDPEKFVQILCGYLMMSNEELGVDVFMVRKDGKLTVTVSDGIRQGRKRKLELDPNPIAFQRAIVCRGTACYRSKAGTQFNGVVKFSWTSDLRPPEADLLQKANARGVKGFAKLVGHERITSIEDMRHGLKFAASHRFRNIPHKSGVSGSLSLPPHSQSFSQFEGLTVTSSQSRKRKSSDPALFPWKRTRSCSSTFGEEAPEKPVTYAVREPEGTSLLPPDALPYANRILRVLAISPAGRSINRFETIPELLKGLRDAIMVHQSLFLDGKILHRDISENNIILTDSTESDGFKGMLIDLDLAKEEGKGPSGARHRTGTMEFMAIEVLLRISHTYRHDLEAFFYVLIWLCARRGWALFHPTVRPPKKSILSRWYSGDYESIAQAKRGDMDKNGLEVILREFPSDLECVKPLCRRIRDVLFPHKDGLFTGTPQDPLILYEPILEAFNDALIAVDSERLL